MPRKPAWLERLSATSRQCLLSRIEGIRSQIGKREISIDLYVGRTLNATQELVLEPCQTMVLSRAVQD